MGSATTWLVFISSVALLLSVSPPHQVASYVNAFSFPRDVCTGEPRVRRGSTTGRAVTSRPCLSFGGSFAMYSHHRPEPQLPLLLPLRWRLRFRADNALLGARNEDSDAIASRQRATATRLCGQKGGNRGSRPQRADGPAPPHVLQHVGYNEKKPAMYFEIRDPQAPRNITPIYQEATTKVQLLAEKVQMTTLISPDDQDEPATLLRVLPAVVVGHLPFGYCDVNFGRLLSERRFSKKPFLGIIQRNGGNYCDLRALRLCPPSHFQPGQVLDANLLLQYNCTSVSVTGITGGHGFQGTVFRYGFNRGPMSHGSRHHRTRGSSGAGTDPGRVRPGTRMPGRMGCMKRTFSGVKVLGVNPSANLVFVRGQVPGRKKSTIVITVTDDQRVLTGTGVREIRTPTK
eukprot:GHVU01048219.1.p1 GENE.GHVU01048219.1~~GHVU01048219.1.p1  ORF type:complete len:401 (-),score=42.80 GHVU01048219.1:268-1470(-)